MPSFPDELPPQGVDLIYKFLIYFTILFVLSTALTTWLVTRRRSFPKREKIETTRKEGVKQSLAFSVSRDQIANLQIKIGASEAALNKLGELKNFQSISENAYRKLNEFYSKDLNSMKSQVEAMIETDSIVDEVAETDQISEEDMDIIQADLEKQLSDLDEDDNFLKTRPKGKMDEIFPEKTVTPPTPVQTKPKGKKSVARKVTPIPPPTKTTAVQPKASTITPPQPSSKKSTPVPPPASSSRKAVAPPPPGKVSPKSTAQVPPKPTANQPLTAAQPITIKSDEEEEGVFAKSTSIAALRMDMLRELARLKKLIPEDQQD